MQVFVGRQPILDSRLQTYGHELLFRSGPCGGFDGTDAVTATQTVLANTFLTFGADRILGSQKGFVNFPRELLVDHANLSLPHKSLVVEVLETVEPDQEVIGGCRRLKQAGFLLALDDFVKRADYGPLIELADFIKVDVRATPEDQCRALAREFLPRSKRMLAEKVESQQEFELARSMGYTFFQGYFFARPQIIAASEVPLNKLNYMRVLRELNKRDIDFFELEDLIRREVSLAHKLLRYVNSAAFGWNRRIDSIRHALVALGERQVRKWVSLAALPGLVGGKPTELIRTSLSRARLCERIAEETRARERAQECFLLGMFSLLDAMIGRPIVELVAELGLASDIQEVLTSQRQDGTLYSIYRLCLACEAPDAEAVDAFSTEAGISSRRASELHAEAIAWAETVLIEAGAPR